MTFVARERPTDSLERIERLMAAEEVLIERIRDDKSLSEAQQDALIREIEASVDADGFPDGDDDWDDGDALAIFARKLGPKGPQDKFGSAITPDREPESR